MQRSFLNGVLFLSSVLSLSLSVRAQDYLVSPQEIQASGSLNGTVVQLR
jgi:hypothetical protein